jgi:hypothetical protein
MNEPVYLHYFVKSGSRVWAVVPSTDETQHNCRQCHICHMSGLRICMNKREYGLPVKSCSRLYKEMGGLVRFVEVTDD